MGLFGRFGKPKETIGLDIGSSAIKLVQLGPGPKGYQLQAMAMVPLPPEAIGEGNIKDFPTVVEAIQEAVSKAGVKVKDAVIAVSGRELIVKKLQLPKMTRKELADAISLEAEQHVPFAIDEVFLYVDVADLAGKRGIVLVGIQRAEARRDGLRDLASPLYVRLGAVIELVGLDRSRSLVALQAGAVLLGRRRARGERDGEEGSEHAHGDLQSG
jgi:type IV pilus assembly protein PilM